LLAARLRGREVTLLSAIDHDSRAFVSELKAAFAREHVTIRSQVEFEPGDAEMGARRAAGTKPGMLVVIADARASAQAVRAAREAGYTGPIAGGPWFGRAAFAEQAGSAAEGAIFSWTGAPSNEFVRKFAARFDRDPDYAAAGAYDSVRIVVAAIRKAGLNRARIRDAIAQLGRYEGASGWIEWDEFGQNRRPPMLGRIVQGRATPLD
jgi:branched-chain amino acid transport system substrate-binding protein